MRFLRSILLFSSSLFLFACTSDDDAFTTSPYTFTDSQSLLPIPTYPDNPTSVEGVALGKKLFYDVRLSGDNTMSCNSCHKQENAFATNLAVEEGIDGIAGTRSSMPLFNMVWNQELFFWDGRALTLEEQTQMPVEDPIEMHETWENAIVEIQADGQYPQMFQEAFNVSSDGITQELAGKAMSQFLRTLISTNSKYDQYKRGEVALTPSELAGLTMFKVEGPIDGISQGGADCFHCHGAPIFTDYLFHNNGLDTDASFTDFGRENHTGDISDRAKFKTPSLRNLLYTAPYMHDGRFNTLEEVIEHYNTGGHTSSTLDPDMKNQEYGLLLTQTEKDNLLAFLKTLSDPSFITNPEYQE